MKLVHSRRFRPAKPSSRIKALLDTITEAQLREWVERISVPRHFGAEPVQNRATANWLCDVFESLGYRVEQQGKYRTTVPHPQPPTQPAPPISSPYHSVPLCPG